MHRKARDLDSVHVPLGLVERKERPKIDQTQEISPERGSEAYQQGYIETKRVEHDAFLAAIGQRQPGEHVVILGEPGAGKTTLLTKVWEWLLKHEQPGEEIIVAWVPLSAVKNYELEEYLRKSWLKQFCKTGEIDRYWASFEALADAGRVWLLLDGADEMGGEALSKIETTLGEVWARSTRAIVTCRLNLWDAGSTNKLQTSSNFQVYRTLDFKYLNPAGQDEVKGFIDNWFRSRGVSEGASTPAAGQKLRAALDEVGKERIKDLAQNPLRLTLLCAFWEGGQVLPETQAGLYELFVDYVYDWKAKEFPAAVKLRGELDRALGVLAKQGINKPSLRFRFTEAELRKWVLVVEQRQAVMDLGWLNCVGEENQRPVFAFFHPTFQEYFAACSIDDWDYFLPRAHVDRPVPRQGEEEIGATYRVFESEWRQPIVLWFGCEDIKSELKEKFIEKLMNFREQEGEFYRYRACCMAAIGVGEFKFSKYSEEIVQQIVKWAFGYFNTNKQKWVRYPECISSLARDTIPATHRGYAIDGLISLLHNPTLEGWLYTEVSKVLGKIADGVIIDALTSLIANHALENWLCDRVTQALGEITVGDRVTIDALISLLANPAFEDAPCWSVPKALGKIAVGDRAAIDTLISLLANPANKRRFYVLHSFGKIAVEDRAAINALISLLANLTLGNMPSIDVLGEIAAGDRVTIDALIPLLTNPVLEDRLHNKVLKALGQIAVGDRATIDAFMLLLANPALGDLLHGKVVEALGQIAVGDRATIDALIPLMANHPDWRRLDVARALGKIAIGNRSTVDAFMSLLKNPALEDLLCYHIANALGKIDQGNRSAIDTLILLLRKPDLEADQRLYVAYALGEIAVEDKAAIDALISVLSTLRRECGHHLYRVVGKIAMGDKAAIDALILLLGNPTFEDDLRCNASPALGKILTAKTMPSAIWQLKSSVTDEVYKSNIKVYDSCARILFHCAQILSYPEFHAVWHQTHLPPAPFHSQPFTNN